MVRMAVLSLAIVAGLGACLAAFVHGQTGEERTIERIPYGDLTDKEHCIRNYVLSYRDRDINRMDEVLHNDYVYCASGIKGEMTRKAELEQAEDMFETLTIFGPDVHGGNWNPTSEFRSQKCEGCWETVRGYVLVYSDVEKPATVNVAKSRFRVIVAPVMDEGVTRYKIRAIEDTRKPEANEVIQAPE